MGDPLQVHDVMLQDVPKFNVNGTTTMSTRLTFYVGHNGPFVREFAQGQADAATVKAAIDNQVTTLRALQYSGT